MGLCGELVAYPSVDPALPTIGGFTYNETHN